MITTATVLLALATLGAAQSGAYGQCGGTGWTGSTSCVSGYTCTYSNPYYSQCIPGGGSTTTKPSSTSAPPVSTTKPSSTAPVSTPTGKVGKLPALGWNSWNAYGCSNTEDKTMAAANQFISLGLKAAGYQYVNIDDCWSIQGARDSSGRIRPDTSKFPDGISGMASKIHNLGLLFGIYSDAGTNTCADYPGSLGNEVIDAQTFASWGVDYLKYDNCYVPSNWTDAGSYSNWGQSNSAKRYKQMSAALATVSRPIEFNLCIWGQAQVWTWGATVGQSWRMTGDASATWSFISSAIANNANYLSSVNFYSHNDMDMMEIGNGALTVQEQRTHFAAWAFMKSPILLGTNLGNLNSQQLAIITNSELLAFSQDQTIGTPAMVFGNSNTSPPENYSGKSSKGVHVFIINTQGNTATKTITFANVPGLSGSKFKLHDMWAKADIGTFSGSWSTSLAAHDTGAWLITPA